MLFHVFLGLQRETLISPDFFRGLRELPRVPQRSENSCGVGGTSRVSDSDHRVPAELGQESQATSFLRNGTPLASRVVHGVSGPLSNCVCNLQVFPDDAWGCQCRLSAGRRESGSQRPWPNMKIFLRQELHWLNSELRIVLNACG